jgi:putative oxidoreductase
MASKRQVWIAIWVGRVALAVTLLSAVADRFGLWGPHGAPHVAWGDWEHFVAYPGVLNSFAPHGLVVVLAWASTVLEIVLGVGLLVGFYLEYVAYAAAGLFALFGLAMSVNLGVKVPLDYSVWGDVAGALLLGVLAGMTDEKGMPRRLKHWGT